jgi:hypothetical protein
MPDDSVSEITELDNEEILTKYYHETMGKSEKKKEERAAARKRLFGDNAKADHHCMMNNRPITYGENVLVEVHTKNNGVLMKDEEMSAH